MNDQQQEIILKLKEANNILVTVSANPSVDQLSAAIGLTILLNKLKKHATAVFSGDVPSTIDFLKPEETLEKNTDSLRDFIIALDKSKADKLRYKVEENIVKIFITPYKTSITQDDLDFSQGDFNVDVVLALGVHEQQQLDQAITAHGRILHDATVISINTQPGPGNELGAINWLVPAASSLSELAVDLADGLAKDQVDGQIATALLTGIVAETERFSNDKTSPETMRLSAELMAAGANQQLVASELQQPEQPPEATDNGASQPTDEPPKPDDGTLEITHPGDGEPADEKPEETGESDAKPESGSESKSENDSKAEPSQNDTSDVTSANDGDDSQSGMPLLPPSQQASPHHIVGVHGTSSQLTANTVPEDFGDTGTLPAHEPELPLLERNEPASGAPPTGGSIDGMLKPDEPPALDLPKPVSDTPSSPPMLPPAPSADDFLPLGSEPPVSAPPKSDAGSNDYLDVQDLPDAAVPAPSPAQPFAAAPVDKDDKTLADLEQAIHSPHVEQPGTPSDTPAESVDAARDAVMSAINSNPASNQALPPKADVGASGYLNVQDLPDTTQPDPAPAPVDQPVPYIPEPTPGNTPADTPLTMPVPPSMTPAPTAPEPPAPSSSTPAPPPVPPPMTDLPPFVNPNK